MKTYSLLVLLGFYAGSIKCSRVLELSDRFLEVRKDNNWLIMFYAPWCAHCKRLEPVWAHVAQSLFNANVRVGKIDCTKYTNVNLLFSITGYPTIKFLKGEEKEFTFNGDRTKEEIVHFARRVSVPPVQRITRHESLDSLKTSQDIFFVYVGPFEGTLWEVFYDVAERFQPHSYFYATSHDVIQKHVDVGGDPSVVVFKEDTNYIFEHDERKDVNASLSHWVNTERFGTFVKVTRGNMHEIMQTNKYLVLAVVEENKLEQLPEQHTIFRDSVKSVIDKHRDKFHRWFQFGWLGQPELANTIAMEKLDVPNLIVVNSTTNHHHIPNWKDPFSVTGEILHDFLVAVHNQSEPAFGGNSLPVRLYRSYYQATTTLADMWKGNPVLTTVLFGLPLGFLSLILYSICCADIMDADDEENESSINEFAHEKKE